MKTKEIESCYFKKTELSKIQKKIKNNGLTVVLTKLFISSCRWCENIALAKGKKIHDKREDLKSKDAKREMDRKMKQLVVQNYLQY